MKKKLATLFMFVFMCLCVFTGCNLWRSDGYANLNAIVATNGDVSITRESLINAYNSSGYYYDQYYGYTRQQAIERTIESLINREYLLRYIDDLAKTDSRYKLTKQEEYSAIKESWEYIDTSITSIVEQTRKELGLTKDDISTEDENTSSGSNSSDYKKKEGYTKKFVPGTLTTQSGSKEVAIRTIAKDDSEYVPETLPNLYDYKMNLKSSSEDYKRTVWNRYITILKSNQRSYKHEDMSDSAVLHRELDKTYKTNIENAKLKKYEEIYTQNYGLEFYPDYEENGEKIGLYYVNDKTLQDIITEYAKTYNSNKELYNLSKANSNILTEDEIKNNYYSLVTNTSNRENYLYYGNPQEDETLLTCIHILVKLSEDQTKQITAIDEDPNNKEIVDDGTGTTTVAELLKREVRSQDNTKAFKRTYDDEGNATESTTGTSVKDIYNEIVERISHVTSAVGTNEYLEDVVKIFDEYIYTYNQDTGIVNAKFDYIVGTKTSSMVNSFTEVVRKLYNDGKKDETKLSDKADYKDDVTLYFPNGVGFAGAISAPFFEEASNYSGYHIVLYTGTLGNIDASTLSISNVYQKLSSTKTSVAYGQTLFEFIYDKVVKDTYNVHQTNLVNSIMNSETKLNSSNYSDLLNS